MKRSIVLSVIALVGVMVLWACGGATGPKAAGENFLNAMAKGDIETAKKYATEDSHSALDMMVASAITKAAKPDVMTYGDVTEDGDKATLAYTENGDDKTLELKKVDGEWKAVYAKQGGGAPDADSDSDSDADADAGHGDAEHGDHE